MRTNQKCFKIINRTHIAFLSLGSNIGNRNHNLTKAIHYLVKNRDIKILAQSKIYETKPIGFTNQPDFLNCVIKIETSLAPFKLLNTCQQIENKLKRLRTIKWGPRTIDIDILLYDKKFIHSNQLVIPHPEMLKRKFVMKPLLEIDGFFTWPKSF